MVSASSTELNKEADRHEDASLSQPAVTAHNGRKRQIFAAGELPDDVAEAVGHTEMDARHAPFDDLIKDWKP
jgi:hypothetical protein